MPQHPSTFTPYRKINWMKLTLKAVRNEKLRRERGGNSLSEFALAIDVPGRPVSENPDEWLYHPIETSVAPHHGLLMRTAERAITTPHGRAMILMPPGSAKSTYCSVVLPAYVMGRWPGSRIMVTSYATDLARKHGRRARQIARSSGYRAIFDTRLSSESSAADEWALTNGSEYMAAGILAGITGNRAHGIVIDDPVKGRDEAGSDVIRTRTREAYEDDVKTRLVPGGWIILIQTRWHEDDLAGSILPKDWAGESGVIPCRDGVDWNVLCIPARADRHDDPLKREIGEYLWPQWFDRAHWAQFERVPRTWSALYQQKPAPDTGTVFESSWLHDYERAPPRETLRIYGASDYAVSDGRGDYTVHIVVGIDPEGHMYVLDLWRRQAKSDVWVEAFCDLVRRWKPIAWAEESGQIRAGIGPFLERRMRERRAYVMRRQFPARDDKTVRAQSIIGRMALEGLYLPAGADWVPALRAELMHFPSGRNDDQVDALGLIGQLIDIMLIGKAPARVLPVRSIDELTMDEVWRLCRPRTPDPYRRI
jgi:predicted phage terminase large subunit-like protein